MKATILTVMLTCALAGGYARAANYENPPAQPAQCADLEKQFNAASDAADAACDKDEKSKACEDAADAANAIADQLNSLDCQPSGDDGQQH